MITNLNEFRDEHYLLTNDYEILCLTNYNFYEQSLHCHDYFECLFPCIGNMTYQINDSFYKLIPGDMLLIGPNDMHRPIFQKNIPYIRYVFLLSPEYIQNISTDLSDLSTCLGKNTYGALHLNSQESYYLENCFKKLLTLKNSKHYGDDIIAQTLVMQILVTINTNFLSRKKSNNTFITNSFLTTTMNYVKEHYAEKICVDTLAKISHMSKYYYLKRFKTETGITVYQYIQQQRLMYARDMLKDGMDLSDVFAKCSYNDYSSFYRLFKKEYGISPKQYQSIVNNKS